MKDFLLKGLKWKEILAYSKDSPNRVSSLAEDTIPEPTSEIDNIRCLRSSGIMSEFTERCKCICDIFPRLKKRWANFFQPETLRLMVVQQLEECNTSVWASIRERPILHQVGKVGASWAPGFKIRCCARSLFHIGRWGDCLLYSRWQRPNRQESWLEMLFDSVEQSSLNLWVRYLEASAQKDGPILYLGSFGVHTRAQWCFTVAPGMNGHNN